MKIDTHLYYLLVNLGCIIIPFIFSFHPKLKFYKNWDAFLIGLVVMMAVFIPWDIAFTHKGIWGFNEKYITGIYIGNLPLEEVLFFICIPYACVFTYHCFSIFLKSKRLPGLFYGLSWLFFITCIAVSFLFADKLYTLYTHALCALLLAIHLLVMKSNYLARFTLVFMILLIPFILSNGILTGVEFWQYELLNSEVDAIQESIVWYNNTENLRLRIFSMPVDDLSYGFSMLLIVVTFYELIMKLKTRPKPGS